MAVMLVRGIVWRYFSNSARTNRWNFGRFALLGGMVVGWLVGW